MVGRNLTATLIFLCLLCATLTTVPLTSAHGADEAGVPDNSSRGPDLTGAGSRALEGDLEVQVLLGATAALSGAYPKKAMDVTVKLTNTGDDWFTDAGATLAIHYNNMTVWGDMGDNATDGGIVAGGSTELGFGTFTPDISGYFHFLGEAWAQDGRATLYADINRTVKVKDVRSFEVLDILPEAPVTAEGVFAEGVDGINVTFLNTGNRALSHLYVNLTAGGPIPVSGVPPDPAFQALGYMAKLAPGAVGFAMVDGFSPASPGPYWLNASLEPQDLDGDDAWLNSTETFRDVLDLAITDYVSHPDGGPYPNASSEVRILVNNTGNVDFPLKTLHAHLDVTTDTGGSAGYGPGGAGRDSAFSTAGLLHPGDSYEVVFGNFTPDMEGDFVLDAAITDAADDDPGNDGLVQNITIGDLRTVAATFAYPTDDDTVDDGSGLQVMVTLENTGNVEMAQKVTLWLSIYDRGNGSAAINATNRVFQSNRSVDAGGPGNVRAVTFANWSAIAPGNYTLRVTAKAINDTYAGDDKVEAGVLVVPAQRLGGVEGRVMDLEGSPVEGAGVKLVAGDAREAAGSAVTGADGSFGISSVILPDDDVLQYDGYFNISAERYPRYALGYADVPFIAEGTTVDIEFYLAENDLPVDLDPHNGDFWVYPNAIINAWFDLEMDPATVNFTTFTVVPEGGEPIPATIVAKDNNRTFEFTPDEELEMDVEYTVTISASVRDADGGYPLWMDAVAVWLSAEDSLETPLSVEPYNGEEGVALDITVVAEFAATLSDDFDSSAFYLEDESGSGVSGEVFFDVGLSGTTLTLIPLDPLLPNTRYTAVLDTTITDDEGRHLSQDYTWVFTTGEARAPEVSSVTPELGNPVAVDAYFELTFTNSMDRASLIDNFDLFMVEDDGRLVPVDGDFVLQDDGTVLRFMPRDGLEPETEHVLRVYAGAMDDMGGTLGEDIEYRFTTAADPDDATDGGDGGGGDDDGDDADTWPLLFALIFIIIIIVLFMLWMRPAQEVIEGDGDGYPRPEGGWAVEGDDEWGGDFQCPECGALVSSEDTSCPSCDTSFEDEEFLCPTCMEPVNGDAAACPHCGERFDDEGGDEDDLGGMEPEVEEEPERDEYALDGYQISEDEYEVVEDEDGIGPYIKLGDGPSGEGDDIEPDGEDEAEEGDEADRDDWD